MMNICFICDDEYAVSACVMLKSLVKSNPDTVINCYTFCELLANKSLKLLEQALLEGSKDNKLVDIHTTPEIKQTLSQCKQISRFPPIVFYRLFIPYLVDETVDRILYLDTDILVNKKLNVLYDFDLKSSCIACVKDTAYYSGKKRLGLSSYMNSGVILFDCHSITQKWQIKEYIHIFLKNISEAVLVYPDQDLLNIMYEGEIRELPKKFNYQDIVSKVYVFKHLKDTYSASIVHFITGNKPWLNTYFFPYSIKYYRFSKDYMNFKQKISFWLGKPKGVILYIKEYANLKRRS